MIDSVDLDVFEDTLSGFRRDESAVLPVRHSPHGDAEAWRLSEGMSVATTASGS
jgi:hypothetical protein